MDLSATNIAIFVIVGLLGIGFYGLLACRNLIKIVIALQILVKAAVLGLITAANISSKVNLGQSIAITVIVADTVVAVVGMALAIQVRRRMGTLDVKKLSNLRG
jgi:NADH-quinone oxidoreductase subunit K